VFVAIHADGSTTPIASGFKAATPRRDFSGKADKLLTFIEDNYQAATNLGKDSNISRNMRGYYAFAWWRYEHAVHPMTASLILEAGFLTNARDRKLLVYNPEVPARGIVNGIMDYLMFQGLLNSS
ncbi:MAG: Cell wall hydrolase/autolysin, partial [Parcubacteria group bacterium GW2011_GWC1_36_9]